MGILKSKALWVTVITSILVWEFWPRLRGMVGLK